MRLTFSVLWFDDSEDYFDSLDLEPLKGEIHSWGFFPDIKRVTTSEEFLQHKPFKVFDLIVVDRNLEEYQDGEVFIEELRSNAIYTEVIFYTALDLGDLWNAVRDKHLEGVFVSSRNDILSKISKVGHQSIRKVLDLENVRGIVMTEVGELDHLLEEIIIAAVAGLSEDLQHSIFKGFHEGAAEQNQSDSRRLAAFIENPKINEMLDLCDSEKRWRNFKRLSKIHSKLEKKAEVGDFSAEVLRPRNFLAHGKAILQEDGSYIFYYRGNEYRFSDETSLDLRQTILRYKTAFFDILKTLPNG